MRDVEGGFREVQKTDENRGQSLEEFESRKKTITEKGSKYLFSGGGVID